MDDQQTFKRPKEVRLLDFPGRNAGITLTENYGKWNELSSPQFNLRLEAGPGKGVEVFSVPAQAMAQVAFRILKQIKDHVPEHVLERMFEQELGPL